ncbi:MAG: ATP-binding protein [Thermoanaerobaculia bacterium]|nr:ATP-binding protein [Thermoanaerobaculia bacterium]
MVSGPPGSLSRLGFRKDVKLFLGALVGYLVIFILVLLVLLQRFSLRVEELQHEKWDATADAVAGMLDDTRAATDDASLDAQLSYVRSRLDIGAIELVRTGGGKVRGTGATSWHGLEVEERATALGTVRVGFDPTTLRADQRVFKLVAAICILGTLSGTLMLVLYVPKILRPVERMLEEAQRLGERDAEGDESHYLIETFRTSIDTLRRQEAELTELHARQKHRADELERLTSLLTRNLGSGFLALDPDRKIVDMNAAAAQILRLPDAGSCVGRAPREILPPSGFLAALEESFEQRTSLIREETTHPSDSGERMSIGLTTVPLIDEASHFLGTIALFTDLTPIRSLEGRVREMQALADVGEISAGIAHEFRNSLAAILGYLRLARRAGEPVRAQAQIDAAEQEAALLSDAVAGLLRYSGPMPLDRHPTDLRALVEEVVERLDSGGDEPRVSIEGSATALCDRAILSRAVENLVRNAIESVRQKGEGSVRIALRNEPAPRIEVTDDGAGLDPTEVPKLFLPFQSRKPGGFGLGLALARKIVLLHKGDLTLTGAPGRGATATIELPPMGGAAE